MPATRPRASFEAISPDFDLKKLVENTQNFSYVDRINCDMIDQQGLAAFEKLVLLHVIINGKPLVIDGFEDRLDPWTFTPKWLRDNCGDKVEDARNLTTKENLPLTLAHYLRNMGLLTNQFFEKPGAHKEKHRQRMYLKDIDCPTVWWDKLKDKIPANLAYLNDNTGDIGGPGAVPDPTSTIQAKRLGRGIARAADLMSSLPPEMRAENLMCYIGHEGTYTPAHREMCASLGHNLMVEASNTVSDDGKAEKPGSSIWFMTESKDRHLVSEYWLSVLGHDIEVEQHFAQIIAWKKAPFNVYVVEQRTGDFILIPPLAPHQVWNRGTRTMKVAWNRTTVETLEMALNEALPRSRIVCRDEQYKNKAMVYYTLQKYASLLLLAQQQAARLPPTTHVSENIMYSDKVKSLKKDFKRLFALYRQILLSEMFSPEERDAPKSIEYLPFDSNVTCAYCRCNIFNRFLSCPSCKDVLGHHAEDTDGDPYDICMECYTMGRSCACISGFKWVEQFRWKELVSKYDTWRKLIISLDNGQITAKTPLPIVEERKRYGRKTLAEVCKDQLKRRPWKDINKAADPKSEDESEEEIEVGDDGMVKKITKKKSKTWMKNNQPCHVCCHRHPTWKMAQCTTCPRWWCYGTLFRGWDKMPIDIMQDTDWSCPHCLGICFAGACKREGKMTPYEPKGTLLGHDTRKVADVRSVETLVDFSISNLNWLRDDDPEDRTESRRFQRANAEAQRAGTIEHDDDDEAHIDQSQLQLEDVTAVSIDPALTGDDSDSLLASRLQAANSRLVPPPNTLGISKTGAPEGYTAVSGVDESSGMYPQPGEMNGYRYPGSGAMGEYDHVPNDRPLRPFTKRGRGDDDDDDGDEEETISMQKSSRAKKPRLTGAGFRSSDLAEEAVGASASKARSEAQRQFEKEKERKALEKAKAEGRFIMLQAAIKGKKRVVKLSIPGARLAQLLAQQAAQAALAGANNDNNSVADAPGDEEDFEDGVARHETPSDETGLDLLKSDIVKPVKKAPVNQQELYQRRVQEGRIVTGGTKKALIPVEKDDTYEFSHRERLPNGKRVAFTAAATKDRRAPRVSNVDYEEVDIGSDDDDEMFVQSARGTQTVANTSRRRTLPNYLQDRASTERDQSDMAFDGSNDEAAANSAVSAQLQDDMDAAVDKPAPSRPPAGKRPSMRPSFGQVAPPPSRPAQKPFSIPGRSRGRPIGANGPKPAISPEPSSRSIEEQNRLAKLEALYMLEGDSMPIVVDDDDDRDDNVDVVPAHVRAF